MERRKHWTKSRGTCKLIATESNSWDPTYRLQFKSLFPHLLNERLEQTLRSLTFQILWSPCLLVASLPGPDPSLLRANAAIPFSSPMLTLPTQGNGLKGTQVFLFRTCMLSCSLTQSCPTLCNPTDHSPPGSSVHGILQARILKWVAISFSYSGQWQLKTESLSEKSHGPALRWTKDHYVCLLGARQASP